MNPAPRIRAQIGLAEQALGQWAEAEKDLNVALSASEDPWISDHEQALKKALGTIQLHLASLTVESNVGGAELWLNGARWGTLPMKSTRVAAGTVNIELRAQGFDTVRRSIEVEPGKVAQERVELSPAPATPTEPSRPDAGGPVADRPPSLQPFFAWGALAATGVVLGGAVAAQLVHEQNANHYNDDALCGPTQTASRDERCGTYRGRAETAQTFAILGYVAGGALGVASAVLFLTAPRSRGASKTSVSVDVLPGGLGAGVAGAF
jgi:hypothetical protein